MKDQFHVLFDFTKKFEESNIYYSIKKNREDAVSIEAVVPGQRWEIDFLINGEIEIEIFRSDGKIFGKEKMAELLNNFSE